MKTARKLRVAVTGRGGQVVSSLIARSPNNIEIIALGRPQLDLTRRETVIQSLQKSKCDVIINAAAYTAVDKAEIDLDIAMRVNSDGAGYVAEAATELGAPLIHISTDYVFDGVTQRPYREEDAPNPTGAYGRSKLEGESQVSDNCANHTIIRTSWVYSPYGHNFVKTMLRLGETREEIAVVSDQIGAPTSALDLADGLLTIATRMIADHSQDLRGLFHMTGEGQASWADFAEVIFQVSAQYGRHPVRVKHITTNDYPTAAHRPANSRLDNAKLLRIYGFSLPNWRSSVDECVRRLLI